MSFVNYPVLRDVEEWKNEQRGEKNDPRIKVIIIQVG
jgi:hypothetical protein